MCPNTDTNEKMVWLKCMMYAEGQKHRFGSTRKNTGRPVSEIRVDPYFCGSTRIFTVRPAIFFGSTRIFTGRPVFYGSTCIYGSTVIYGSTRILRVDPYLKYGSSRKYTDRKIYGSTHIFTGRPVFLKYGSTRIGASDPLGTP